MSGDSETQSQRRSDSRSRSPPRRLTHSPERDRLEPNKDRKPDPASNPGNNLFVSNLNERVRDSDLEAAFLRFGRIENARVMVDPHTRDPRGFGFVTFRHIEDAEDAIDALDGKYELMGRIIRVQKAKRARPWDPTPGEYRGPPKPEYLKTRGSYDSRGRDVRRSDYRDRRNGSPNRKGHSPDDRRDSGRNRHNDYDDRRGSDPRYHSRRD